jgi:hypothetical protein
MHVVARLHAFTHTCIIPYTHTCTHGFTYLTRTHTRAYIIPTHINTYPGYIEVHDLQNVCYTHISQSSDRVFKDPPQRTLDSVSNNVATALSRQRTRPPLCSLYGLLFMKWYLRTRLEGAALLAVRTISHLTVGLDYAMKIMSELGSSCWWRWLITKMRLTGCLRTWYADCFDDSSTIQSNATRIVRFARLAVDCDQLISWQRCVLFASLNAGVLPLTASMHRE